MSGGDFRRFMRKRIATPETTAGPAVRQKVPVMFVVPSASGSVNWTIAQQIGRMMWNSLQPDCPFTFDARILPGVIPVQYARNVIVSQFLASNAQWLIMVDDDQVVPENFWELMSVTDADVVSGLTNCWVGNGYLPGRLRYNQYSLIKRDGVEFPECFNVWPPETNGQPYRVPIVGTGCIAIRRHVVEALGPDCFRFTYKANGSIMGGEDINFCQMVNQMGFIVAVHPGVKFGHVKTVDLGQVAEFVSASKTHDGNHNPVDVLSIGA